MNLWSIRRRQKTAIETYAEERRDNYCESDWTAICKAVTDGKAAIDAAVDKAAVDIAIEETKESIDVAGKMREWTLLESADCCPSIVPTDAYWVNHNNSMAIYMEALPHFKTSDGKYTDDFGGAFYDCNGIINICVVGNREPIKSDYLIYKRVENSQNFLHSIQDVITEKMKEYSVWSIEVCSVCNQITIYLENKSNVLNLVEYLKTKNLYKKDILNFFVGKNEIVEDL